MVMPFFFYKGGKGMEKYEVIKFKDDEFELDVKADKVNETVWLNTEQIASLFGRDYKTIRKHINNALKKELNESMVVAKFESTIKHGAIDNKIQTHDVSYYNLDVIISVGYRVKTKRGIVFRRWANKVLKEYLIEGYSVNNKSKLVISSGALTALTLLVAESDPKEKEIMVRVVMNILFNKM